MSSSQPASRDRGAGVWARQQPRRDLSRHRAWRACVRAWRWSSPAGRMRQRSKSPGNTARQRASSCQSRSRHAPRRERQSSRRCRRRSVRGGGAGRLQADSGCQRRRALSRPHPQHPSIAATRLCRRNGARPQADALAAGVKVSGCTVHIVTADVDAGQSSPRLPCPCWMTIPSRACRRASSPRSTVSCRWRSSGCSLAGCVSIRATHGSPLHR